MTESPRQTNAPASSADRCCAYSLRQTLIVLILAILSLIMVGADVIAQESKPSLVAFTANWCANCREIIPLASEVAQQNGLSLSVIDVDDPTAPKRAKASGLSIPGRDLPQIYAIQGGAARLILDGASVGYGQADAARARLLKGIQAPR